MQYIEITFTTENDDYKEMLVALLHQTNVEGFEETSDGLKAFFKRDGFDQKILDESIGALQIPYNMITVEEENWNAKWESSFEPILLHHPETHQPFAFIRASFHQSCGLPVHDILITPKMSFGTGHHATTFQMMEQMSLMDFQGLKVLDFGTGTGLLAILAEKMGAATIEGIDNDDWSISNALENIEANQCRRIEIIKDEICKTNNEKADVILANINLNIIISNLDNIIHCGKPGTIILFSGILSEDKDHICLSLSNKKLNIISVKSKNNWLLLTCSIL